jgi:hypothetical protein
VSTAASLVLAGALVTVLPAAMTAPETGVRSEDGYRAAVLADRTLLTTRGLVVLGGVADLLSRGLPPGAALSRAIIRYTCLQRSVTTSGPRRLRSTRATVCGHSG